MNPRLEHLATLRDGWLDGDGKAIGPGAIARADDLLRMLSEPWMPYVYPTPDGGVQIEFDRRDRDGRPSADWLIEIEIEWDGSACGFAFEYEGTDEKLFGLGRTEDPHKLVAWLDELDGKTSAEEQLRDELRETRSRLAESIELARRTATHAAWFGAAVGAACTWLACWLWWR